MISYQVAKPLVEVEQVVDLHYTAADLNRLLHLHASSHDPITFITITYNLIRQAPPQTQDRPFPLHTSESDTHPPFNPGQFAHPPSTSAFTRTQDISNAYSSSHPPLRDLEAAGLTCHQYNPSSIQWPCQDVSDLSSQTVTPALESSPQFGAWVSTVHGASFGEAWVSP